jgi:hypothetical protein
LVTGESLKTYRYQNTFGVFAVDPNSSRPSADNQQLELLRSSVKGDATIQELLRCLSDGLWHTTTELARRARSTNPVVGMVTVGTILSRMQKQFGKTFLEQMVQKREQGVSSWRVGMEWIDIIREVLQETE